MRQPASAAVALAAALVLGGCTGSGAGPVVVSSAYGPERLLTELSAQATPDGVKLAWKVDEARAHRITGFTCVYRTPGHLRLGVAGSVACGDELAGPDVRERTVAGLPEYGEYLFEVTALISGAPVIGWTERALNLTLEVTRGHAGPPGPAEAVTGTGPVVFGCGPNDGPGDVSEGRPWQQSQIVSAEHLTHYPGRGWTPGGDSDAPPEWPEPTPLGDLFDQAGLDGQAIDQALDAGSDPADGTDSAADRAADVLADDSALVPLARASAGTKTLLRPGADGGWELRLHTSYPFGADYVYNPGHAVAGWGDAAHPTASAGLWNRTDCPPPENPDATHDVALALSDDAGDGRRLEHSGYGWWAVAPVGMFPERIVATKAALSFGDPAAAAPQAPAAYRGRAAGHLFVDQQRYALAGDLTLTLESADGTARLAGRIDNVVVTPLDHDSLQPRPGPPSRWPSLTLEAAELGGDAWSGTLTADAPPDGQAPAGMPDPETLVGDWHAQAHGPDATEIAGRLRLYTPLAPDSDPDIDWPAQAVLVAGFAATAR